jgi:hypothetical protein
MLHYQILENTIGLGPMGEGFAYTENLGWKLVLKDPYQYFGMLEWKCTELCDWLLTLDYTVKAGQENRLSNSQWTMGK